MRTKTCHVENVEADYANSKLKNERRKHSVGPRPRNRLMCL